MSNAKAEHFLITVNSNFNQKQTEKICFHLTAIMAINAVFSHSIPI